MKLIEQIRADRMVAFKAKENIKKNILGCLISESCKENKEPADEVVLAKIKKFIEGAKEIQEVSEVGSYDYFQANVEIEVLDQYRPKQMTEDEVRTEITACLLLSGKNLPQIMQFFKNNLAGRYDGKMVSTIAKELLEQAGRL